jgi:hypothetical protein
VRGIFEGLWQALDIPGRGKRKAADIAAFQLCLDFS